MGKRPAHARLASVAAPGGLLVLAGACLALGVWDLAAGWLGVATGVCGIAGGALRRRSLSGDEEAPVWGSFGRGVTCLALGFGAALVLHALAPRDGQGAGLGIIVGVIAAVPAIYQGMVHWNRYRTSDSDPGDWLNGLSAVLALVALGTMLVVRTGSPLGTLGAWGFQLGLLQYVALFVLIGTASTILVIGGLTRDLRAWVVAAGLGSALLGQTVMAFTGAAVSGSGAVDRSVLVASAGASWLMVAVVLGIASRLPEPPHARREATSETTSAGAVIVLAASVLTLLTNALDADPSLRWSSALAALAALVAGFRVLRLVSELAQMARTRQEARTDDLTGIANRRRLTEILVSPPVGTGERAVLVIDLERFKEVNDHFGHEMGDDVIRVVAQRLRARVRDRGTVARLGGDEFALVLDAVSLEEARWVAAELLAVIREPVDVEGAQLRVDASIGVACSQVSGGVDEELMRCADAAMYAAKRAGGGVSVFDEVADARARGERQLTADLREVLTTDSGAAGEIVVHYQPQLRAGSGRLIGLEALVRWEHPTRGLLPPLTFLPLAERAGLMTLVTAKVLDQAVGEVVGWFRPDSDVRLAVNLSSSCLADSGLVDMIDATLVRHGMPGDRLITEVTETSVMEEVALAVEVTRALAARGIGISIDDFGTGYSSLARLNALPFDELKLDRSFTMQLAADERTAAIVAGTIDFAHRLGLRVVAEGVEDHEALEALRGLGCDVTQGYLHSRPLPAAAMAVWLSEHAMAAR